MNALEEVSLTSHIRTIFVRWMLGVGTIVCTPFAAMGLPLPNGALGAVCIFILFCIGLALGIALIRRNRLVQRFMMIETGLLILWILFTSIDSFASFAGARNTLLLIAPLVAIIWFLWMDKKKTYASTL